MSKEDELLAAQNASHMRSELTMLFNERRANLVKQMMHRYRNETLNHDYMVGCIAELAGMDMMIDKLTREVQQNA